MESSSRGSFDGLINRLSANPIKISGVDIEDCSFPDHMERRLGAIISLCDSAKDLSCAVSMLKRDRFISLTTPDKMDALRCGVESLMECIKKEKDLSYALGYLSHPYIAMGMFLSSRKSIN